MGIAAEGNRVVAQGRRRPNSIGPDARCPGAAVEKNRLGALLAYASGYAPIVVREPEE